VGRRAGAAVTLRRLTDCPIRSIAGLAYEQGAIDVESSDVIAAAAVAISVIVFAVQRRDRGRDRRRVERAQAEQIAGWLSLEDNEQMVVRLRNASSQPIYDLLWMVRDSGDLDVVTRKPFISVLPPQTTIDLELGPMDDYLHPGLRVYLTFRDGHGQAWQRDSHGRLIRIDRGFVDDAPPAKAITGLFPHPDPSGRPRGRWPWNRYD
jgi:hypothetical protein